MIHILWEFIKVWLIIFAGILLGILFIGLCWIGFVFLAIFVSH